jgi:hypothetical protein
MAGDHEGIAAAYHRCAGDDAIAVQRNRLRAGVAEVIESILELEVHHRPLDPDLESWSMHRHRAIDLAQRGQFFGDRLGIGAAGGKRLLELRLLLSERRALLHQLVVGAVEIIDQ